MGHLHIMRLEQETTLINFFQNVFAELYTYLWATLYITGVFHKFGYFYKRHTKAI